MARYTFEIKDIYDFQEMVESMQFKAEDMLLDTEMNSRRKAIWNGILSCTQQLTPQVKKIIKQEEKK